MRGVTLRLLMVDDTLVKFVNECNEWFQSQLVLDEVEAMTRAAASTAERQAELANTLLERFPQLRTSPGGRQVVVDLAELWELDSEASLQLGVRQGRLDMLSEVIDFIRDTYGEYIDRDSGSDPEG